MNILEIKNVEKSFNNVKVIDDVSLNVKEGETVVIIGASGSGKSTLLRCINNLEKIDSGFINVNGLSLIKENKNGKAIYSDKKVQSDINLSLGMVFQDFNLFPHLSVLENITKGLEVVFNKTEQEAREDVINEG
jgi:polar amino acid transport system ATP-binding protein